MNDSLYQRMKNGEANFAVAMDSGIEPGVLISRVKRRRAGRAAASLTGALTLAGVGAAGAFAWWPAGAADPGVDGLIEPAAPSAVTAPPIATEEPPSPAHAYGEDPIGLPVLEPASPQVANAVIDPRPGPDFVVGERAHLGDVVSQEAIDSCVDALCGMPSLPPVTQAALDSGELSAVVHVSGVLNGGQYPYQQLDYITVAGPQVGAYLAVDLSEWAIEAGLRQGDTYFDVTQLAGDPATHTIGAVIGTYVPGDYDATHQATVVLWDLDTGTSTIVAEGLDDASIEWDGERWGVYGYGPEGSLGVLVAADAGSWTTDGVEVAPGWSLFQEGAYGTFYGRNAWTTAMYLGGEAYPSQPEGMSYCDVAAVSPEGSVRVWCVPGDLADEDRFNGELQLAYQLTPGVGWEPLDDAMIGALPPQATSSGALGDGFILWRGGSPIYLEDGVETPLDMPNVEPDVSGLADGGLWMVGLHELGWIGPDLAYTQVMTFGGDLAFTTTFPYGERSAS